MTLGYHTGDLIVGRRIGAYVDAVQLRSDKRLLSRNGFVKRLMDIAIAIMALAFLLPVMIFAAIAVKLTSSGPVLYKQTRIGRNSRLFSMYKFRTMRTDSDVILENLLSTCPVSAAEWNKYQKLQNDPRVTLAGRFLRKSSIDELPQLLNVLNGTMSIVGQRPLLANQLETYGIEALSQYARHRPGITGLWQVSGRNQLPFEARASLDIDYARNWSLGYDLALLVKTVPVVLFSRGAC